MAPTIPAAIIAARGKQITLIDGSQPHVVFTFSAVMRLEEEFGSIAGALEAVQQVEAGKAFGSIANILAAGLEHEKTADGHSLGDVDVLRYLLDSQQLQVYSEQLGAAFEAAFPKAEKGGDDSADPTQGETDSLGLSGSTSEPSSSDAPLVSSGA